MKYKENISEAEKEAAEFQLKQIYEKQLPSFDIKNLDETVSEKVIEKFREIDIDVYKADYKMSKEVILSDLEERNIDEYIEYVQPDYEMSASDFIFDADLTEYDREKLTEEETQSEDNTEDLSEDVDNDKFDESSYDVEDEDAYEGEESGEVEEEGNTEKTYEDDETADIVNSFSNTDIIVALIDTGIDITHSDLAGSLYANEQEIADETDNDGNGYTDDINGWDFVNNDNSVNDIDWYYDQGHATMIAGIIKETAPEAKILPLKVFQGGIAYTSDIIAAITYADLMGASIANCSWGSHYENPALREAIENSGMLFVCAAGNTLYNIDNYPVYPASFKLENTIAVASVDADGKLSRYSNYGVETIDASATGTDIYSTWLDNGYNTSSGTSMSAGFVSGLAALLKSQNALSAAEIKTRIVESSDTITGLSDKIKDGKRINLEYALSGNLQPNYNVIDIPDDEELPEITPYGDITEEFEEFGAEYYIDIKANLTTARHGLQAITLNGKIYAIGRQTTATSGYSNKVEVYDPATNTWATAANMNAVRSYFGAVVYSGKIYVFGGYNGSSYLSSVESYNPSNNTWTTLSGSMPLALSYFSAVLNEATGKVYIIGGTNATICNTVYEYTIASNTWTTRASITTARKKSHGIYK
ncbi:hypothetical protein FACS1894105_10610 [Clostridia bacterium]|nr:hypothetical protein FACS1894105_10610 [Clostridia bacterium]